MSDVARGDSIEIESLREQFSWSEEVVLLPREQISEGTETRYVYESDAITIEKLLNSHDIGCELATDQEHSDTAVERAAEVGIPDIMILYGLYKGNKELIRIALEKIGEYYVQRATREIEVDLQQEDAEGKLNKFSFKGHPADLPEVMTKIEDEVKVFKQENE